MSPFFLICISTHESGVRFMKKINGLFYELVSVLVPAITVIAVLFTFCFRMVGVSGDSMDNTLADGDWLLVMPYYGEPDYGDIIISTQENSRHENIVKRIIAKEGDVVDRAEDGTFTRNGEPLDETAYIINGDVSGNRYGSAEFPLTVPENCVFVLGDNRPISLDSRYADIGFIQEDYLLGKAIIRVGSDWNIYE